jgi:hypothetical protein
MTKSWEETYYVDKGVLNGAQNTNSTSTVLVLTSRLYFRDTHKNNQTTILFHSSSFKQFLLGQQVSYNW